VEAGKGSGNVEFVVADRLQIGSKDFAVEMGGEGLDEEDGDRFGFLRCESNPGSIKVGIGEGLQPIQQQQDSKVIERLLVACLVYVWL